MMLKTLSLFLFGTLRGRIIIGVAAVHAVMMTLFIYDLTARQRAMLLDRQKEEATALTQALATSAAGWIAADDISGLQELVEAQRSYPEVIFAILADREGRVLADTDKSGQGRYMLDLPREARRTVLSGTPALVDVAVPAIIGGSHVGWARVGIGQKATGEKLAEITRDGVVYALAAILIGSVIAWFMGHRITRRLYAVQETIDAVRSGNRLARSSLAGADEAAGMAREFNSMLDALAERDAELRESEEKYRTIFQNSPLGIFRSSFEGRFLDVNPATARILGYDSPEAVIREIHNIAEQIYVHAGDRQRIVSEQLGSGDITTHYLNRFRRKDSSEFIANLYMKTIHDAEGRPIYLQGVVEDITEQKKVEETLQRAAEEIRDLYNHAPCGYHSLDKDGVFVRINETELEWLGYRREEVIGKMKFADLLTTGSLKTFEENFPLFKASGVIRDLEFELIRKDSSILPVLLCATTLTDNDGNYLMSRSTVYDITERNRAEEALHRLNRELRAISDCNQVLIRAEDEQTLLNHICRIVCDEAGYRMAWVGYAENDDASTIHPIAWAGVEEGYLEQAGLTWSDTERGRGPTGNAIRSGESACIQDFTTDPQAAPWRESALQRGYRSSISLPLKDECANTFGILNIYSTEPNAFTPDEIRLLEELAGDLAFGIMVLRSRIERKQAEEALTHLAAIVESSDDAIIGKSLEGNILSWNSGAERLYGYREEEIKGRSVSILIPQDLAGEMPKFLDKIKDGKAIEHYETSRLRKDGSRVEVSLTVSPICDAGGKIVGASTIARDITELRKTELEFRKLNEELEQRIVERTTNLNKRRGELLESQQALMNIVEDLNEKTSELEQANSKLQELDRLKSMFIASMSHELRTPLNSVIGFSSVLLNEWVGPINAEQKENLAIILRSGKHLLNLINDVIDVSKIEAGKIESTAEEFDLHDLIDEAVSMVKKEMGEKGLDLRVAAAHQRMRTDRRRLLQCVLNLLSNAVKFTEQGGVTVETRIVRSPGATPEAGVAEISVTDTGIGIREEDIGNMFQPFVRLYSPLQATIPGTGLGLYLTRKLAAEILKGDILLTSEYGKGSRFTIKIPVGKP